MLLLPEPTFKPLRIYSDGSGTQSVAALVLQAQGKLPKPFDVFVFANVGEDSESEDTLNYRREYIEPFAAQHGIQLAERWRMIGGKRVTLYEYTVSKDNRSIPIPVAFRGHGFGNRTCTEMWKVEVVNSYIKKETDATHVEMGIGFSVDEGGRIFSKYPYWHNHLVTREPKTRSWKHGKKLGYWRLYEFPLAQLRLSKADCIRLVKDAGLPEPPPSLCWYCPFTPRGELARRKRTNDPRHFRGIELQTLVNEKYAAIREGSPHKSPFVGIHPDGIPLEEIPDQMTLWDDYMDTDSQCQTGICGF